MQGPVGDHSDHCRSPAAILERARLRAHFKVVLAELAARDVSDLTPAQRAQRTRLLVELAVYAQKGRFPKNRDFRGERRPYFVDASGTRCAMAHLIESTGERDLVARVGREANHARVHELAADVALRAWLSSVGLTVDEAARIQPSYCFATPAYECVCDESSVVGVIECVVH